MKSIDGHKLSARSNRSRVMDYPKKSMEYYYHPTEQNVFVSRHALFLEKKFILEGDNGRMNLEKFKTCNRLRIVHKVILNQKCPSLRHNHNTQLSKSRVRCIVYHWDMALLLKMMKHTSLKMMIPRLDAILSNDSDRWLEAMKSEIDSMNINYGLWLINLMVWPQ